METTLVAAVTLALKTDLPALFTAASLSDMAEYTEFYIDSPESKTCSVYPAESRHSESEHSVFILAQFQLPGILDIQKYADVIWKYAQTMDANEFGFITLELTIVNTYPGSWGDGGAGGFVMLELDFYKPNDSCD